MESAFAKNAISDAFPSLFNIHKKNCAALGQENRKARERTKRHEQLFAFVCAEEIINSPTTTQFGAQARRAGSSTIRGKRAPSAGRCCRLWCGGRTTGAARCMAPPRARGFVLFVSFAGNACWLRLMNRRRRRHPGGKSFPTHAATERAIWLIALGVFKGGNQPKCLVFE